MSIAQELLATLREHAPEVEQLVARAPELSEVLRFACECLVTWNIPRTCQDPSAIDAIVAFSLGLGADDTPGRTNTGLARYIAQLTARGCRAPILAQWEIADALAAVGVSVAFKAVRRNGYLSTKEVWDQVVEYLRSREICVVRKVLLVAHPYHMFRCLKIMEGTNRPVDVLIPNGDEILGALLAAGCDQYGLDPDSTQPWTANILALIKHELSSRLYAYARGDISDAELRVERARDREASAAFA